MTKCYTTNGLGGPIKETILTFLTKNTIVGYVPLKAGSRLEIQPVLDLHAGVTTDHLVEILMRIPYDASKNNHVLKKRGMAAETMERVQGTKHIPTKPPYKVVELIATLHSIHYDELLVLMNV